MCKRLIVIWAIANFAIVGIASVIAGQWYLGWQLSVFAKMWVEIGLIILPNLLLSFAALRYGWIASQGHLRSELAWRWEGWRSIVIGFVAFVVMYFSINFVTSFLGDGIPYRLPDASQENSGIAINGVVGFLNVLGVLGGLLVFITFTVMGEESMFRGLIQTQVGKQYGAWVGLLAGVLLFGLRHLPNDIFYARLWQATPQMWVSRQVQLYLGALVFGLARHFGKSTYSSAITHGLYFFVVLFG